MNIFFITKTNYQKINSPVNYWKKCLKSEVKAVLDETNIFWQSNGWIWWHFIFKFKRKKLTWWHAFDPNPSGWVLFNAHQPSLRLGNSLTRLWCRFTSAFWQSHVLVVVLAASEYLTKTAIRTGKFKLKADTLMVINEKTRKVSVWNGKMRFEVNPHCTLSLVGFLYRTLKYHVTNTLNQLINTSFYCANSTQTDNQYPVGFHH